jgi:hypothetical protein
MGRHGALRAGASSSEEVLVRMECTGTGYPTREKKPLTAAKIKINRVNKSLRRPQGPWRRVARQWRLCRFRNKVVEDEAHAAFVCNVDATLTRLRADFLRDVFLLWPDLRDLVRDWTAYELMMLIIQCRNMCVRWKVSRFAGYWKRVVDVYDTRPLFIPPANLAAIGAGTFR